MGTPMMTVAGGMGGNRNALNKPVKPSGQRDWSFGTFDCFSACGTCVFAWFCPCFVYGKNSSRLNHLNTQGTPHPAGGDMVCPLNPIDYPTMIEMLIPFRRLVQC